MGRADETEFGLEATVRGGVSGFAPAKLRAIRTRAGISVEALAAAVHVSSSTVRKWEQGTARPRPNHLTALGDVLDQPVNEFLRLPAEPTLRQRRESAGLTTRQAAEAGGVSTSTVNRVELGSQRPGPDLVRILAQTYQVTTQEIEDAVEATREQVISRTRRAARDTQL